MVSNDKPLQPITLVIQFETAINITLCICNGAESVAYEIGSKKGIIQYTFPAGKQPDTEEDSIALGFITTKADAVLLRIESSTTQDYMELEIVRGSHINSQSSPSRQTSHR